MCQSAEINLLVESRAGRLKNSPGVGRGWGEGDCGEGHRSRQHGLGRVGFIQDRVGIDTYLNDPL